MHRSCTVSSTNTRTFCRSLLASLSLKSKLLFRCLVVYGVVLLYVGGQSLTAFGQEREEEPIEMSVVVVNPSSTKTQSVPIKMYLPQEVTPDAILDTDGLDIEFDSEKSMYYVYSNEIKLSPSETKTFNVEIKDVWKVPQGRLDSMGDQAASLIKRLEGSEFYDSAMLLGEAINKALNAVSTTQNDPAVSRRTHIGIYRNNLRIVDQVKEDVERLEKQFEIVQSLPKPEVLEDAELKTDSPTKNTSWMIIFIIMIFIAMLAGVFFFTWHAQAHSTRNALSNARLSAFPEQENSDDENG